MPVKIRLAKHGKKGYAFYHIVVADSRAPRDGKFIEKIGVYNPNTNPATIDLSLEKAIEWLQKGAQPTDTCRSILSLKGVMYKKHLLGGVKKGAFTIEEADAKFALWLTSKTAQLDAKVSKLNAAVEAESSARFAGEVKINQDRAKAIQEKRAAAIVVETPVAESEAVVEETPVEA